MATAIGSKDPGRTRAFVRVIVCALLVVSGLFAGITPVTAPTAAGATGHEAVESCSGHDTADDCHPEDGASGQFDLSLSSTLVTTGVVVAGLTVQFSLVPHNNGPSTASKGWSVADQLPDGLTLTSAAGGDEYDCTGTPVRPADVTCVARASLASGADGAAVTVTARVEPGASGSLRNESWVAPTAVDGPETNPLVVPPPGTDTTTTATDNDAHVDVLVAPTHPGITVDKRVERTVDVNRDGSLDVSDEIFYAFVVTNTGNVPLTGLLVQDDLLTRQHITLSCTSDVVAAGGSVTCRPSAPYRISRADVARGLVVNGTQVRAGAPAKDPRRPGRPAPRPTT